MQKNRFLTFLFSLIPGCGFMYLGYMKKGLQFMALFAAAGFMAGVFSSLYITGLEVLFIVLLPIIWFYQMFDAMHTVSRMRKLGTEMPMDDDFILSDKMFKFTPKQNRTAAKIIAGILIAVGSLSIIMNVIDNLWRIPYNEEVFDILYIITDAIRYNLIPGIVSIILIIIGIKLLSGKRSKAADAELYNDKGGDSL